MFTVEVKGLNELVAGFKLVEKGLLDFRQLGAWKGVRSEFRKIVKEHFDAEGNGKSGKWAPLSPKYKAIKDRKYGALPTLQRTKRLYKSLTSQTADSEYEESAQEMSIGTKVPYAAPHQTGANAPARRGGARRGGFIGPQLNLTGPHRGGMPARPPLDFTDEQEKRLMKPIQAKLKQLVANARLKEVRGF